MAVGVVKVLSPESRPAVGMSPGAVPPRSPPREGRGLPWFPGAAVPDRPSPLLALWTGHAMSRGFEQHWSRPCHLFCVPLEEC